MIGPERLRTPLALKLGALLGLSAGLLLILLVFGLGPRSEEIFRSGTEAVLDDGRETMGELALRNTQSSREVLIDLIRHTTESRRQLLEDLPLGLHRGDEDAIRRAIQEADAERSGRLERNVEVLAGEMQRRSDRHIEQTLAQWRQVQDRQAQRFAGAVRGQSLLIAGGVFGSLLLVLGLGLYQAVVRPLRRMRAMTQAVRLGTLSEEVAVRSRDEVGALSRDFAAMVRELRESREEVRRKSEQLERWNEQLGVEVAAKTRHLEEALDDLRRTQRELVHAAKMASVGTLAGGVAHEFNNVIGGIRGCAAEALTDETSPDRREDLEVILRAADRGAEVTRQLLRFSRRPVGEMHDIDLADVLDEVLKLIGVAARRQDVEVQPRLDGPLPLRADGGALHQVFLNLANNALQAMPEGGRLQVRARREGDEIRVGVEDQGTGISPEHLDRIYEPFFTTRDQAVDPASRGTGLGLSVSYSIVEAHGGRMEVESEEGKGTRFTVILPLTREGERE